MTSTSLVKEPRRPAPTRIGALLMLAATLLPGGAGADTRISVSGGESLADGGNRVNSLRLAVGKPFTFRIRLGAVGEIVPRWEVSLGNWDPNGPTAKGRTMRSISVRVLAGTATGPKRHAFLEAGTGPMYLSNRRVLDELDWGSKLQIDSHIGVGRAFGKANRYRLVYRLDHASNGGFANTNPGMNFQSLQFSIDRR